MNIPLKVLKSTQLINSSSLSNHQSFGKQFIKLSAKAKSNSRTIKQNKEDIFTWFFSLDSLQRLKVISIQNNWLVKMVYQMLVIYKIEKRIKFKPTNNYDEFHQAKNVFIINDYIESSLPLNDMYYTFFEPIQPPRIDSLQQEINNHNMHELLKKQNDLISNLRFITINEVNDTLTLSLDLLNNEASFRELFILFSDEQCFATQINATYLSNNKVYNFSLPQWSIDFEKLTMCQLLIFYLEQSISSNYRYYCLNKNSLYRSPSDDKLRDLIENNAKIENYLHEERGSNNEKFISLIDYNKINDFIRNDIPLKDLIAEYNDKAYKVMEDYRTRIGTTINSQLMKNRTDTEGTLKSSFNKSIPLFVDMITFIDSKILYQMDNFVYQKVFKMLLELYSKKNANELIKELTEEKEGAKKNKKNKRKSKKDEEDKMEPVTYSREVKEVPMIQKIPKSIEQEERVLNEKQQIEKGKKKKNKELFLYTVSKKKTQSKKGNEFTPNQAEVKDEGKNFANEITNANAEDINKSKDNNDKSHSSITISSSTSTINNENHSQSQREKTIVIEPDSTLLPKNKISISISNPIINNYYIIDQQPPSQYNQLKSVLSLDQHLLPFSHYDQKPFFPYRYPYYTPQQVYLNQYQPFPYNDSSQCLFNQLHKEIDSFAQKVSHRLSLLKECKQAHIAQISALISSALKEQYDFELVSYGSYVTGLGIESSDIDIVIKFKLKEVNQLEMIDHPSSRIETVINLLVKALNQVEGMFDYIKPIYSASVPQWDISKTINQSVLSNIKQDFWFDITEIEKIKLDLTFFEIPNSKYSTSIAIPFLLLVEYVDNSVIRFPEIKPLLNVLKRYMQIEQLNQSFKGGISSYSLFLLLLAFLKYNQHKNANMQTSQPLSLGKALIEFLSYYSSFDFSSFSIDVNALNPFIPLNDIHEGGMLVLDPFTSLNVAKSSFKLDEIKSAFKKAHYISIKHFYSPEINDPQFSILKELFGLKR